MTSNTEILIGVTIYPKMDNDSKTILINKLKKKYTQTILKSK